jgi:signal transduction histidine kinase/ActR/RegA family two-component response regulator
LNFSNIPNFTESFSIGISKDAHPLLYSIINKTLNSISEEEITTVIKNNTHRTPKNSFLDLAYTNPLDFFLILTSIFLLFVIVVILSLFTILTKKKNIEIAESFKVKFDFLSRMSHDLRTPLNAITGYLSLAKDNISNPKMLNEYLDKMNSSSSFLLGLVNDCLDVGKNFSDKLVLHPEPYTYPEFEKTVLAMIEPLCKKKNIKFVYPSDYYKVSILVDKIRFEQIFFNLLTNAIKFTPEGGTVEFLFKNRSIFNNVFSCDYYIKDTGIGISPEFQKKLFTPFEQENNGTDIMSQGSGLGLAIVKSIVELMDGTISVQSEKGKGTTFIVHLDLPIIEIENQEETKNKFEKETETNILDSTEILEGKKVLLIEDHPMNIEIAKELLEKKGMSVVCASNGKEGLETFENSKENEIDLIITDIRMPIMSGQEMTEKIRQLNRNDVKTIPIIAITANILDDDIKIYHKSGINDFVEKPIKPDVLYKVLRKQLG